MRTIIPAIIVSCLCGLAVQIPAAPSLHQVELTPLGTYASGVFGEGAAEIVAHDPGTQRLFVVNAKAASLDVLDISDPSHPNRVAGVSLLPFGGVANSVAVRDGIVAIAVESVPKTTPGKAVFFDSDLNFLSSVPVGSLPDMLTFSPNGRWVLVANEGEPNSYNNADAQNVGPSVDPEGSVSIIDLSAGASNLTPESVRTAGFAAFNDATLDPSIRIFGPNATVAQDLEPEYVTISQDSMTAWVTLQENNALAVVDIASGTVTRLIGLGAKDHALAGNAFDASDRDGANNGPAINIRNWPVKGLYLPDGIDSFQANGQTFLVLANEGDARADWPGYNEEVRVNDAVNYPLDPVAFPNAADLRLNRNLGRLRVTLATGDTDGDGDFDVIHSFGGRSFSIRDANGALVFDSGDQIERLIAALHPGVIFNASHDNNTFDSRSPTKGPEAEGVVVGRAFGRMYAFVALERVGGIATYDISDPYAPFLSDYVNFRDFTAAPNSGLAGDLGPEGIIFIKAEDSPNGNPLVVLGNEISGTTTVYQLNLAH
jgi:2',3'-cyclic-nucleotide 2'-phosphodiesterase / 3'-nucleotidase / 5'-nucleotidase